MLVLGDSGLGFGNLKPELWNLKLRSWVVGRGRSRIHYKTLPRNDFRFRTRDKRAATERHTRYKTLHLYDCLIHSLDMTYRFFFTLVVVFRARS
jgi:hypothetical protein